jgi:hypothetical protein
VDKRAVAALQRLSQLPPEVFQKVFEVLAQEFSIPQPVIRGSFEHFMKPPPNPAKPPQRKKAPKSPPKKTDAGSHGSSRAGKVRDLLKTGPKTTAEILAAVEIPNNQIHPVLASIGAMPIGETTDEGGYARKLYGFKESLIRDEAEAHAAQ